MSKFLYGIVSRKVAQTGDGDDNGYDSYDPIFEEDGSPQILLAEKVVTGVGMDKSVNFHLYYFDGEKWLLERDVPPLDESEVKLSLIGKWKFNAAHIAMNEDIFANAIMRASVVLSKKIVVCLDNAMDFRLLDVVRPMSDDLVITVAVPDTANPGTFIQKAITCDMIVKADHLQTLGATATTDTPEVKQAIGLYMANRAKTATPRPPPVLQHNKISPRPSTTIPTHGSRKMPPPIPHYNAAPPHAPDGDPPPGGALRTDDNTGHRVTFRYSKDGNDYVQQGRFTANDRVTWDSNGSNSRFPPNWDGISRTSFTIHRDDSGDEESDHPGQQYAEFDVFNDVSWIPEIERLGLDMVMLKATDALKNDPRMCRPWTVDTWFGQATKALRRYLEISSGDLDATDTRSALWLGFREAHLAYICAWGKSQNLDPKAIEEFVLSKREGKSNFVRQGIDQAAKGRYRGGSRDGGGRYGRGGRAGGVRGGRGGRGRYGPRDGCYICQGPHRAQDCPYNTFRNTPSIPDGTTALAANRGAGPGFRGGRGGPRT